MAEMSFPAESHPQALTVAGDISCRYSLSSLGTGPEGEGNPAPNLPRQHHIALAVVMDGG